MEGFLIRWDLILSGWRWLQEHQVGVYTTCGAVSTLGTTVLIRSFLELKCMEGFLIRGWDLILPGWRWLQEHHVGVSTPCGAVPTRGNTVFVPDLLEM